MWPWTREEVKTSIPGRTHQLLEQQPHCQDECLVSKLPSLQTHVLYMLSHLRSLSRSVSDSTSPRTCFYVSAAPFPVASISCLAEVSLHSFCINCLNTQTLTCVASTLERSRNSKTLSQYHWHAYNLVRPHCFKMFKTFQYQF